MNSRQKAGLERLRALNGIPDKWKTVPLSALYQRRRETGYSELMPLSVFRDHGVIPREEGEDKHYNRLGSDLSSYQRVEPGDLVLNKMKTWQGSLGVSAHEGIVSPAYIVCKRIHDQHSRYLEYLLRSDPYILEYARLSYGVRVDQWDLRYRDFKSIPCILPPKSHQRAIAKFLDSKTSQIDSLIAKKKRLIELLEEKRTALITRAVTKGLDTDVPMKDSGVEWLGEIPAHWETRRPKHLCLVENSGCWGEDPDECEDPIPVLRTADVDSAGRIDMDNMKDRCLSSAEEAQYTCQDGDIVVVKSSGSASNVISGKAALIRIRQEGVAFSNFMLRLRPRTDRVNPEFLYRFLTSHLTRERIHRMVSTTTYPNLDVGEYVGFNVAYPPLAEQGEIAEFLKRREQRIWSLIDRVETAIDRLEEYRSALITAAVTGTIDVRDYAA